jgi:hypothetical protein
MLHSIPCRALQTGALLFLVATNAAAGLISINPSDFSGSQTVVTFSGLPAGTPVSANYLGQGVFFGFGLFAATEADTATNAWDVFLVNSIPLDFTDLVSRVGFDVKAGDGDLLVLTAIDTTGTLTGSFPFIVSSSYSFVGIGSDFGISQFWIEDSGFPGTFSIQNLQFDSWMQTGPAGGSGGPEPWSVVLTGPAALYIVWRRCGRPSRERKLP